MRKKENPHRGGRFVDFLKEEGIYEEVVARAEKELAQEKSTSGARRLRRRK
jgi:hypothetical protein